MSTQHLQVGLGNGSFGKGLAWQVQGLELTHENPCEDVTSYGVHLQLQSRCWDKETRKALELAG